MTIRYMEEPVNLDAIKPYLSDFDKIMFDFYERDKALAFYDTCSLIHHSNSSKRNLIANAITQWANVLVITRTVLMELAQKNGHLHETQIEYIKILNESGLKVVIFNEEYVGDIIEMAFSKSNQALNQLLAYAIYNLKSNSTIIQKICEKIESDASDLYDCIFKGNENSTLAYEDFFRLARSEKTSQDSLAEDLIFICFMILSSVPSSNCLFLSDDTTAFLLGIRSVEYIEKFYELENFFLHMTTPRLAYRMYTEELVTERNELVDILNSFNSSKIRTFILKKDSMRGKEMTLTRDEFVDNLLEGNFEFVIR